MVAILNFGSIFKKSLAHPHVAINVMLKFQRQTRDADRRTESSCDYNLSSPTGGG